MKQPLKILSIIFFAGYLILILATFKDYAITQDEKYQKRYGELVLNYYTSLFEDKSFLSYRNLYLYGGLVDGVSALLNKVSPFGEYETRHLWNALLGFFGVLAVYLLVYTLTHSHGFSLLGVIFLFLSPRYYGHSFNNPKDIPFAAFYVFSLLAMVRTIPYWTSKRIPWKCLIALSFALGCTLGVRIGGVILVFYLILFHSAWQALRWESQEIQGREFFKSTLTFALFPMGLSLIWMIAFWPYVQSNTIENVLNTLQMFKNFPFPYPMFFQGDYILATEVPWDYVLTWYSITTPLIQLLGLALLLIGVALFSKSKLVGSLPPFDSKEGIWSIRLILFAMIFPVATAIISKSTLYDGLRHFLFLGPLTACLAALGFYLFYQVIARFSFIKKGQRKLLNLIFYFVIIAGLYPVASWQIRSHPNQYVYFNEVTGGLKGAFGKFDIDYYGNSERQAALWLNDYVQKQNYRFPIQVCSLTPPIMSGYYLDSNYFLKPLFVDYAFIGQFLNDLKLSLKKCHFYIANPRWGFLPKGETIHSIKVDDTPLIYIQINKIKMQQGIMEK